MSTSPSPKHAESTAVNEAVRARMAPKQAAQAAPVDITANPVAKIVFNPEATPEERSRQVGTLLSPELAEDCKTAIKQVEAYKEYLAQQRTLMQRKLIELSSTTVFAKMKQTFADMNKGVPATAATPTRNTMVPAAKRKPKKRRSSLINPTRSKSDTHRVSEP